MVTHRLRICWEFQPCWTVNPLGQSYIQARPLQIKCGREADKGLLGSGLDSFIGLVAIAAPAPFTDKASNRQFPAGAMQNFATMPLFANREKL